MRKALFAKTLRAYPRQVNDVIRRGNLNCEAQLRESREYLARRGGRTGASMRIRASRARKANRPALDRLMADAAKRKFDAIVVYKLERFGPSFI